MNTDGNIMKEGTADMEETAGGTGAGGGPRKEGKPGGMALASMILSLLGLFCTITAIAGLVLGIIELNRIKRGESPESGKGMSIAGIIIGSLVVAVALILLIVALATGNFAFDLETQ
jgi:hypothetical protein